MNVDEEIEKGYKDSDISPQFITCLTYFGELRIYGGSNVWLSQTGGKLVCYAWNDSNCEIHSSSSSSSSSSSLPSSYLKFYSSWFAPSLFNSESSLVTHFLIGNSKLISNRPEPLAEDVDASRHVCVWTYLEPGEC
ncbi:protein kinase [Schistosoma mansoni]|uniref:protein kinase n=1 Tax=Schistosoma mansoni TaxID=6183 RepID=UPI00022C8696|nr:protein kinase [Schistosoma mansoni]|eukprot:XP_018644784.1 protein kinase [Schistosoma mansoni]